MRGHFSVRESQISKQEFNFYHTVKLSTLSKMTNFKLLHTEEFADDNFKDENGKNLSKSGKKTLLERRNC